MLQKWSPALRLLLFEQDDLSCNIWKQAILYQQRLMSFVAQARKSSAQFWNVLFCLQLGGLDFHLRILGRLDFHLRIPLWIRNLRLLCVIKWPWDYNFRQRWDRIFKAQTITYAHLLAYLSGMILGKRLKQQPKRSVYKYFHHVIPKSLSNRNNDMLDQSLQMSISFACKK